MKWTELCLGPIQRRLEAFLGFLVKIKMKAYNAELNRLLVGSGQIPLNIELKQVDRTVCCSDTVVSSSLLYSFSLHNLTGRSVLLHMESLIYGKRFRKEQILSNVI